MKNAGRVPAFFMGRPIAQPLSTGNPGVRLHSLKLPA
jgi:hypothetical protein